MSEKLSILLIEDDEIDRITVLRELKQHGKHIRVNEAIDANAARQFVEQNKYDCILLDYGLPGKSGLDFLKELQKIKNGDVPTIVLTCRDDEELGLRMVQEGAQDYLVKKQMNGKLLIT